MNFASVTFLDVFFWFVNCTIYFCNILGVGNDSFEGFSTGIHKKGKSNLYLRLLANFSDLEMVEIWSVNYIYQVCKLNLFFGHLQNFGQYSYQ